ncbi:MAG: hypothetical protein Q9190_000288 [Brigantiaea leucoxantha]
MGSPTHRSGLTRLVAKPDPILQFIVDIPAVDYGVSPPSVAQRCKLCYIQYKRRGQIDPDDSHHLYVRGKIDCPLCHEAFFERIDGEISRIGRELPLERNTKEKGMSRTRDEHCDNNGDNERNEDHEVTELKKRSQELERRSIRRLGRSLRGRFPVSTTSTVIPCVAADDKEEADDGTELF